MEEMQSGSITNDYRFTGKAWDAEAGLFYFNARWMDPETGRFISEDPLWGNILDPQSLNRFAYGRNNPFRYVDPTGREGEDVFREDDSDDEKEGDTNPSDDNLSEDPTITYINDEKERKNPDPKDLKDIVNEGIRNALDRAESVKSININSGLRENSKGNHRKGEAFDYNRINGKRVDDPTNIDAIRDFQDALSKDSNIRENYGPTRNEKTVNDANSKTVVDMTPKVGRNHENHGHASFR